MKYNLMPADTYVVCNKTILKDQDRKILTMLYQPIIGSIAINLYFTLWDNLDRTEILSCTFTHHILMCSMRIKLEDIIEAREKLEAMGLIKTYIKKDTVNHYIYELYSPLSAYDFINNPILSTTLYNNIGALEYNKTISYFKIPKLNLIGYENITCTFQEVFVSSSLVDLETVQNDIRKSQTLGLSILPTIDFNNILSSIPEEILNYRSITIPVKEFVYKLAFIYNLNDDCMIELIRNSINEKHTIDKNLLRDNCRNYYQFEHSGKLPSLIYRNQPEYLRKPAGDTSPRAKMIYTFETISPYDFLCSKNNGVAPSKRDLKIVEMLLIDYELKPGVINVLIDYVLRISNNKLIPSYVSAIADQWRKSKIETVEGAMNIAEKEYQKKQKKGTNHTKELEKKPEWFDKVIEEDTATDEEIRAFEEKLRKKRVNS